MSDGDIDGAWLVLPTTLGGGHAALDSVLLGWAVRRGLSTLAYRAATPAPLPGAEYDVWTLQLMQVHTLAGAAADLSFGVRATVGASIHLASGSAASLVFRDGFLGARHATSGASHDEVEAVIAAGLSAFVGPLDVGVGWLRDWLARARTGAEVRVVRWNGGKP